MEPSTRPTRWRHSHDLLARPVLDVRVGLILLGLTPLIFHVRKGQAYHLGNSLRGIRKAARTGHREIDLDLCITSDRHIVGNHWRRPLLKDGFRDPLRRVPKNACIDDLTFKQVRRLVAFPGYRIQPVEKLLRECARVGIIARLEPKGDKRFEQDWPWEHIKAVADQVNCEVRMYALRSSPVAGYGERVVPVAARNKIPGKVIR